MIISCNMVLFVYVTRNICRIVSANDALNNPLGTVSYILSTYLPPRFYVLKYYVFLNCHTSRTPVPTLNGRNRSLLPQLSVQLRATLSVMVVLGLTWLIGAFTFGSSSILFQYCFTILNGLQVRKTRRFSSSRVIILLLLCFKPLIES